MNPATCFGIPGSLGKLGEGTLGRLIPGKFGTLGKLNALTKLAAELKTPEKAPFNNDTSVFCKLTCGSFVANGKDGMIGT